MSAAREPTPLVVRWRREEAEASAWFWDRGYRLDGVGCLTDPDRYLCLIDPGRHERLLAAIHALDLACAHERPKEIAEAGKKLVKEWKSVIAFMRHNKNYNHSTDNTDNTDNKNTKCIAEAAE